MAFTAVWQELEQQGPGCEPVREPIPEAPDVVSGQPNEEVPQAERHKRGGSPNATTDHPHCPCEWRPFSGWLSQDMMWLSGQFRIR